MNGRVTMRPLNVKTSKRQNIKTSKRKKQPTVNAPVLTFRLFDFLTFTSIFALFLVTGCVRKETSHTLYLDPDGAVTWMVLEKDIRSDANNSGERDEEEEEFMAPRRSGEHDIAQALANLDADWVETRILRETRPYMVVTEARFESLDGPLQAFFDQMGAPVSAEIRTDGDCRRLVISCDLEDFDEAEQNVALRRSESDAEEDEVLMELIDDADKYRLVLTDGEFVEARGFELTDDDTVAALLEQTREEMEAIEEVDENGNVVVYSLTWTVDGEQ